MTHDLQREAPIVEPELGIEQSPADIVIELRIAIARSEARARYAREQLNRFGDNAVESLESARRWRKLREDLQQAENEIDVLEHMLEQEHTHADSE